MNEDTGIALIAPCGINCGSCKAHLAGTDDEALVERLAAWLEKEAEIKQRYFSGRMEIGRGSQLD